MKLSFLHSITDVFGKNSRDKSRFFPHRDWFYMLIGFFIVVAVMLSFSVWLYLALNNGAVFRGDAEDASRLPQLHESTIKSVADFYREKKVRMEALYPGSSASVDPAP